MPEPHDPNGAWRAVARHPLTLITAWYALFALCYLVFTVVQPSENAIGCTGIGFGCTPSPRDAAFIAGLVVVGPSLALGFLLSWGVYSFVRISRPLLRATVAAVAGLLLGLLVIGGVAGLLLG